MIVLYLHLFVLIIISFVINIIKNISFKKKLLFGKGKKTVIYDIESKL